jgi:hypothetical protein
VGAVEAAFVATAGVGAGGRAGAGDPVSMLKAAAYVAASAPSVVAWRRALNARAVAAAAGGEGTGEVVAGAA